MILISIKKVLPNWPSSTATTFFALAISFWVTQGECEAQFLFQNIQPSAPARSSIDPKALRKSHLELMPEMSKQSIAPAYQPKKTLLPHRIMMGQPSFNRIRPKEIHMTRPHWATMTKQNIEPEHIRMHSMYRTVTAGPRLTTPTNPGRAHWNFNPTMMGHSRPVTHFDSSIRSPIPDYDSPLHRTVLPPPTKEWVEAAAPTAPPRSSETGQPMLW